MAQLLAWRGVDPDRIEAASVQLGERRLSAHGASTTPDYVLSWRLETDDLWVTRDLEVHVDALDGKRDLFLRRAADGSWSVAGLDGALDCDLGLCPFTNTMPILRHGLHQADAPGQVDVEMVMAWVSVPDLTVSASRQRYRSGGARAGGNALVRFDSAGFGAPIEVDRDGFVVDYPGIGRRVELG
jgi:uncharacterized protein